MANAVQLEVLLKLQDELTSAIQDVSDKVETAFSGISGSAQKAGQKARKSFSEQLSSSLRDASVDITKLTTGLDVLISPIKNFFNSSIQKSMEFESAFTGIKKTFNATETEYQQLAANIREMSLRIPVDTTELSKIGEIAGQLGIQGVEDLTKFIETIALLGMTTDLTSDEGATKLARFMGVMQEPIENVNKVGAAIVDLGNNYRATEAEILNASQRIAGAAHVVGLSADETLAIGTAIIHSGTEAEAGGTAVQKVLLAMSNAARGSTSGIIDNSQAIVDNTAKLEKLQSKLAIATQKQSEFTDKTKESVKMENQRKIAEYTTEIAALEGELGILNETNGQVSLSTEGFAKVLGMTSEEYSSLFQENPAEAFQLFVHALQDAGGDAMDILEEVGLKDQRLIRTFLNMAGVGDDVTQMFFDANKAMSEGAALTDEAGKRMETLESKFQIAQNAIEDIQISVGDVFNNTLKEATAALEPILTTLSEFIQKNPQLVETIGLIAASFGVLIAVLTTVASVMGAVSLISGAIGTSLGVIIAPIMAVIAGVVLLYEAWNNNWFGIRDIVANVWSTIKPFLDQAWAFLQQLWADLGVLIDFLIGKVQEIWTTIDPYITAIWQALQEFWDSLSQKASEVWAILEPFFDTFIGSLEWLGQLIRDDVIPFFTELWDTIVEFAGDVLANCQPFFDIMMDGFNQIWQVISEDVIPFITDLWNTFTEFIDEIWGLITQFIDNNQEKIDTFKQFFDAIFNAILIVITWVWNQIKEFITVVWDIVSGYIMTGLEVLKKGWTFIWDAIVTALKVVWEVIKTTIIVVWDLVSGIIKTGLQILNGDWEGAWTTIKETFKNIWDAIWNMLVKVWENIKSFWDKSLTTIKEIGENLVKGLWEGIEKMTGWIGEKISGFVSGITDKFKNLFGIASPSKIFAEMGKFNIQGLEQGMQEAIADMNIPEMAANITTSFDKAYNQFTPLPTAYNSESTSYDNSQSTSVTITGDIIMNDEFDVETFAQYLGATVANAVY